MPTYPDNKYQIEDKVIVQVAPTDKNEFPTWVKELDNFVSKPLTIRSFMWHITNQCWTYQVDETWLAFRESWLSPVHTTGSFQMEFEITKISGIYSIPPSSLYCSCSNPVVVRSTTSIGGGGTEFKYCRNCKKERQ
jgi:hypothetical protein